MFKNLLLLSLAFLVGSCCNKKCDSKNMCENKPEKPCCAPIGFGKVDSASLHVEILPEMSYPEGSPVAKWGKLKVAANEKGVRSLCSADGKPVQLRGMSSHGLQWPGVAVLTEANMKALREDWNCNIFRIALYVDEEGGYAYNRTHLTRHVENVVKWCAENGMYCLIDWHVHAPGDPQHWKYRNRPETGIDLAADFFTYCARRFQNQKHVIYELCNEPNGKDEKGVDVGWETHIKPYCEDMLKIIRGYDSDVVVVCGTPSWSQRVQDVIGKEPQDENGNVYGNLMYTYHFYAASHNDGRPIDTKTSFKGHDFMKLFREGDPDAGIPCLLEALPIFVTEWGTTDASGWTNFRPDLSDMWLEIFNGGNNGNQTVSWCNWSLSAEGGVCGALNWNDGNLIPLDPNILSESGKYIINRLKTAKDLN
jgi:endoglucanase